MLILTWPVVKTGHYWSIGGRLKWLIGLIKSLAYKIVYHMPLSFRHDCLCCSVATARVLSNLLKQVFQCICVNIVIETLQQSKYTLPSSKVVYKM